MMEGRYSKLGGIKPQECLITHDVLEVFEVWGLLVPVLLPAVVGAGVVPGLAGLEAAGVVAGSEAAGEVGARVPDAVASVQLPPETLAPIVNAARVG